MSMEQAKSFVEKVRTDATFAEEVKVAKTAGEVVKKAEALGYSFTQEDLQAASTQMSDAELNGVLGGVHGEVTTKKKCGANYPQM